jgi:hypothetical protein
MADDNYDLVLFLALRRKANGELAPHVEVNAKTVEEFEKVNMLLYFTKDQAERDMYKLKAKEMLSKRDVNKA